MTEKKQNNKNKIFERQWNKNLQRSNNNRRNTGTSYSDSNDEVTQQLEALDVENSSKN